MQYEIFWHNPAAEQARTIPTGARAGRFIFLSAQTPINLETGRFIRDLIDLPSDIPDQLAKSSAINAFFGPVMAQTWQIYQNLTKILDKQGSSLDHIVRQRLFVPHLKDINWAEQVMLTFFPGEKPATLMVGVPDRGLHPDLRVFVEIVALIPQTEGAPKQNLYLPELEKVTAPYPQAVRVGQYLFYEGYTGVDLNSGRPVTKREELGNDAREVEVEGRMNNLASEARRCQLWLIFSHLNKLVASQNAAMDDFMVMQWFSRQDMWEYCNIEYIRAKVFTPPVPLGFGTVIHNLSIVPEIMSICGGIVLLPGEVKKASFHYAKNQVVTLAPYACVTRSGSFAHGGGMGINITEQRSYVAFADLPDNGRFQAFSRIDGNHPMMAKMWHIYKSAFEKAAVTPRQVIHQTLYMENPAEYPAVETIARIIFGGHIPPTTVIPVDDIAFYWQYHMQTPEAVGGERIEVEFRYFID